MGETSKAWAAFIVVPIEKNDPSSLADLTTNLSEYVTAARYFAEDGAEIARTAAVVAATVREYLDVALDESGKLTPTHQVAPLRETALAAAQEFQRVVHAAPSSQTATRLGLN